MPRSEGRGLLVVPANNTTMESEMNALCPMAAPFSVARVRRPPGMLVVDDLPAYLDSTLAAVAPFVAAPLDLVVYGCTAAGFLGGPEGNARVVAALGAKLRTAVVSTAGAMVEVLRHEGVRETAVVTPYLPDANEGLRAYLEHSGIAVEVLDSFLCPTTDALGRITAEQVLAKALATITPRTQALFIACSQLPTLSVLPVLRARFGFPVWSSIQATAWAAERALSSSSLV